MQAVVKAPRINVTISGRGIKSVVHELEKGIAGLKVRFIPDDVDPWIEDPVTKADEQETVNPFSTAWYRKTVKAITPGKRLDAERFKRSLTQTTLSKMTGIPQHHISEMENGKRPIGKETAKKLAAAFSVDYRVFL
jgi:DNA-binding XRE family transcriptional regulator